MPHLPRSFPVFLLLLLLSFFPLRGETLKSRYDAAPAKNGYDRYVELETGATYTGGLHIGLTFNRITAEFEGEGEDVRIKGNGAILDLEGAEICISYCDNRLDIDDCVILNGNIRYRGVASSLNVQPVGWVRYVTFYKPEDYGVRIFGAGTGITLHRNLCVDAVCTGGDFMYLNGTINEWLATGGSFTFSAFTGTYGTPVITENWSYHEDLEANGDPLRHFPMICEYG